MQDTAVQELAALHEQSQALTRVRVQLQKDTSAARQDLASAQDTARCGACRKHKRCLCSGHMSFVALTKQLNTQANLPGIDPSTTVCLQLHSSSMC